MALVGVASVVTSIPTGAVDAESLPCSASSKISDATRRSFSTAWSLKRPASAETAANPYGLVWLVEADGEKKPARMMKYSTVAIAAPSTGFRR